MAAPIQLTVPDAEAVTVAGNLTAGTVTITTSKPGKPSQTYTFTHGTSPVAVTTNLSAPTGLSATVATA